MSTSSGQHLTTSRIQRIFRPLRAKCATLASHVPAAPHQRLNVKATYSHIYKKLAARASAETNLPPLTVLPPPGTLGSRIHIDKANIEHYELSKKVYDVRDAFRNIVQLAMGPVSMTDGSRRSSIISLAGMCAAVIGDHIQHDIGVYEDDDEATNNDEDIASRIMDELYESVPAHYRSCTVVAHALNLVLGACPHTPTLLHGLLDVCVAFGLHRESQQLVRALLVAAVRPNGSSSCPVAHRAHATYLVNLFDFVSETSRVACAPTFTFILLDVLSHADSRAADAWSSTAVSRLAHHMKRTHFGHSFLLLCGGLTDAFFHVNAHQSKKRRLSGIPADKTQHCLGPLLAKWMKCILEHVVVKPQDCPSTFDEKVVDYHGVVELLTRLHSHQALVHSGSMSSTELNLNDLLVCLATYCLASPLFPHLSGSEGDTLHLLLHDLQPRIEAYDVLLDLISSRHTSTWAADEDSPPPRDPISTHGDCRATLYRLAESLRSRKLFLLEASLWSSALRHVEPLFDSWSALPRHELTSWTAELVENVERAEACCFGSREGKASRDLGKQGAGRGEWRWEEMVGCWVQATPKPTAQHGPAKHRKIYGRQASSAGCEQRVDESAQARPLPSLSAHLARDRASGNGAARASISAAAAKGSKSSKLRGSLSMGALSGAAGRAPRPSRAEPTTEDENEDPLSSFAHKPGKQQAQRLTKFSSILANAQANWTVLHPRDNILKVPPAPIDPSVSKTPVRRARPVDIEGESPACDPYPSTTHLSSDDALNLFAYSSPVAYRR